MITVKIWLLQLNLIRRKTDGVEDLPHLPRTHNLNMCGVCIFIVEVYECDHLSFKMVKVQTILFTEMYYL